MTALSGSGGFTVELDKKYWAEFKRQVRAATNNLDNIDHAGIMRGKMREALTPLANRWRQNLPGSLKATVKIMPTSLVVRAGNRATGGNQPFLPWLEFGGTVKWYRDPAYGPFKRVPVFGFRMRKVMGIHRTRNPFGVYRWPAIYAAKEETEGKVADAIQQMLNTTFHAP